MTRYAVSISTEDGEHQLEFIEADNEVAAGKAHSHFRNNVKHWSEDDELRAEYDLIDTIEGLVSFWAELGAFLIVREQP